MKRKASYTPGLFDSPAWEQEAAARTSNALELVPPCPAPIATDPPQGGAERWIQARAAALALIRGMTPASARALADIDLEEMQALDVPAQL